VTTARRTVAARMRSPWPGWAISLAAALAVVGFVTAAQWKSSPARQQFTSTAQQVLANQALDLQAEHEALRQQIGQGEAELQRFQTEAAGSQTALEALNRELEAARLAVGLAAVSGPGVIVEIADSKRVVPPGENPARYIVQVDDLRDIVTALWASGAEAIAINEERLVSRSSIYGVGASILVNTGFLSPPFRIQAIGPASMHQRFLGHPAYLGRVAQRITDYGLEFATVGADEVSVPRFIGSTAMRWGVPVDEAGP